MQKVSATGLTKKFTKKNKKKPMPSSTSSSRPLRTFFPSPISAPHRPRRTAGSGILCKEVVFPSRHKSVTNVGGPGTTPNLFLNAPSRECPHPPLISTYRLFLIIEAVLISHPSICHADYRCTAGCASSGPLVFPVSGAVFRSQCQRAKPRHGEVKLGWAHGHFFFFFFFFIS